MCRGGGMSYSYDRSRTARVDSSVLGYTADDIKEFDTDERQEAFTDVYHQALDLLTEIQEGFSPYLNQGVKAEQLDSVKKAVKLLKATRP